MGIRKNLVLTGEELISQPAVDDVLVLFDPGPRVKAEAIFQDNLEHTLDRACAVPVECTQNDRSLGIVGPCSAALGKYDDQGRGKDSCPKGSTHHR